MTNNKPKSRMRFGVPNKKHRHIFIYFLLCTIINNNLNFEIDNICISDTCGTLSISDYKYIIDNVNQDQLNKISLHLHNPSNPDLQDIIQYSLARNITRFDVSYIDAGGCSVTIDGGKMKSNLTYEIFE